MRQPAGEAEVCDEEEDGSLLSRGESSVGDAGRRAGGGAEERPGEETNEGEREAAAEETQSGRHAVWR